MAQLWMDGFDHYGTDILKILDGAWANIVGPTTIPFGIGIAVPPAGARTGLNSLRIGNASSSDNHVRRILGVEVDEVFAGFGLHLGQLPTASNNFWPIQFRTAANAKIGTLTIRADGSAEFRIGDHFGAIAGTTTSPVFVASTWHHVEVRMVRDATIGIFELRVDEVVVMSLSGLNLGASNTAQVAFGQRGFPDNGFIWIDDVILRDASGTTNNTFMGDLKVATLQPVANGVNQGWTARNIQKLSVGVMNFQDSNRNEAIAYTDDPVFEIGAGDFAIEAFVRFNSLLTTTQTATIASKHRISTDERSWRLLLNGPDVGGNLVFATSSDGTAPDEVNVHAFPFIPETNRWYHIAVARSGTDSRMFLDGQQIGLTQTDSRAYDDNAAQLFVNGHQNGVSTARSDESFDGWMDGFRFTVGVARYVGNFTPPAGSLPTDVPGDALFNNVQLLLNFDTTSNVDESTNAFVGVLINAPFIEFPDDGQAFQTIDGAMPNDDNFVEAALVSARETLTFAANPLDGEVVVMGADTYKFVAVLAAANDVLIGATASDSMDNLRAAVNFEAGEGTLFGTGTLQNPSISAVDLPGEQLLAIARTPGVAGNALVSTTTVTGGSWGDTTLSGGADIPANSEFSMSALPAEVTGIRAVAIVGRNFKLDSGSSQMQMSFVVSGGGSDQGAARPVTVTPTYQEDTFERDPGTLGALTPSTLAGARIRLNRTL